MVKTKQKQQLQIRHFAKILCCTMFRKLLQSEVFILLEMHKNRSATWFSALPDTLAEYKGATFTAGKRAKKRTNGEG